MDASSSRGAPLCSTSFPTPRPPEANPPGDRDFLRKQEGRGEQSGRDGRVEDESSSLPEGHLLQQVGVHLLSSTFCLGVLLHRRREERGGARRREEVGVILGLPDVSRPDTHRDKQETEAELSESISGWRAAITDPPAPQPGLRSLSPPRQERTAPARCPHPGPVRRRPGLRPGCRPPAGSAAHT